jgi:hypothetical protein
MEHACKPVVGVDRRQHPDLVTAPAKLLRKRLNMSEDATRVRVGIGANQTYAHT